MNDLINTLYQLAKTFLKGVADGFDALSKWFGKMWWFVVAFILTPITWVIDAATETLEFVKEKIDWVASQVEGFGLENVGETFGSFSYFLGLLDNFVPVSFLFFCAGSLVALWAVCTFVRILIRLIPTAG